MGSERAEGKLAGCEMAQPLTDASQAVSATRRIPVDMSVGMASSCGGRRVACAA